MRTRAQAHPFMFICAGKRASDVHVHRINRCRRRRTCLSLKQPIVRKTLANDWSNERTNRRTNYQDHSRQPTHNLLRETLNGYAAAAAVADEKQKFNMRAYYAHWWAVKCRLTYFITAFFVSFFALILLSIKTLFLFFWPADVDHFSIVFSFSLFENTINFVLKLRLSAFSHFFFSLDHLKRKLSFSSTYSQLTLVNFLLQFYT